MSKTNLFVAITPCRGPNWNTDDLMCFFLNKPSSEVKQEPNSRIWKNGEIRMEKYNQFRQM